MRAFQRLAGGIVAGRRESVSRPRRRRLVGDGPALDIGGNRQAEQVKNRRSGVDQAGIKVAAGTQPRTGESDDALGTMGAGKVGVRGDPGPAATDPGAYPIGVVGHGDEVRDILPGPGPDHTLKRWG